MAGIGIDDDPIAGTQVQIVRMPRPAEDAEAGCPCRSGWSDGCARSSSQHGAHAEQRYALRGPVARRAHAVALARDHDDGASPVGAVALGGPQSGRISPIGDMHA